MNPETEDNCNDGALSISVENIEEINGESTPSNTPGQTVDISDVGAQNVKTDDEVSQRSEEHVADKGEQTQHKGVESNLMLQLEEPELIDLSDYITYENQERISVMLGFDLNKVETLRCKHRENVTGVNLDLLIDWTIRNPQPTNRMVSSN